MDTLIFLYGSWNKKSPFYKFRKKYFKTSEPVSTFSQCRQLNGKYEIVVTGSDVVWQERNALTAVGMLGWASGNKTLLSYAASFGEDCFEGSTSKEIITSLLSKFDSISVREDVGVNICKSFNVSASHVLDPSLLLDAKDYEELIDNYDGDLSTPRDYVFFYDAYTCDPALLQEITRKFEAQGLTLITGECFNLSKLAPEQWLNFIKNARYVITHSFHGLCFSILFQKNFFQLNQSMNTSRYNSLYKLLGLKKRGHKLLELDPLKIENEEPIDYAEVDKRLSRLRKHSIDFLSHGLSIPQSYKAPWPESLLRKNKIIQLDENGGIVVNENALEKWVEENSFDPSYSVPVNDLLKQAVDIKLDEMFYAYETEDERVLREREYARKLLLADAKRVADQDQYKNIVFRTHFIINEQF